MLDTPQARFKPLKSLKKPLSKSDLVGELPTGFFVFLGLFSVWLAHLWSACGAVANSGSVSFLLSLIRPDSPGSSLVQLVKYAVSFVFGVADGSDGRVLPLKRGEFTSSIESTC
ncbi:MAG: hypothetical protein AB7V04_12845 [Desulfomonilaceae bacterium]